MSQLMDYCKSCIIEQIGDEKCSINGLIKVSENHCVSIEMENLSGDCLEQIKANSDNRMFLKTMDYYVTIIGYWVIRDGSKGIDAESGEAVFFFVLEVKKSFWGSQYCIEMDFDDFTFQVTEGAELIGLTPYENLPTWEELFQKQFQLHLNVKVREIHENSGLSCFVAPQIQRVGTNIHLEVQHGLRFSKNCKLTIKEIEEERERIILLLEILCGERVAILNMKVRQGEKIYEYLGIPWISKKNLKVFEKVGKAEHFLARRKLFKLSDFENDFEGVTRRLEDLVTEDKVAFGAYQQLLMDDELRLFTVNNFLKVMQMAEGLERQGDRRKIHKEFAKKRDAILEKVEDEDVKTFITEYCNDTGEEFKACLNRITGNCLELLSRTEMEPYE